MLGAAEYYCVSLIYIEFLLLSSDTDTMFIKGVQGKIAQASRVPFYSDEKKFLGSNFLR